MLPAGQVMDVRFEDFMQDMKGTVKRILDKADHEYTDATDKAIDAFLENNPPGKHGRIDYEQAMIDLGIDLRERGEALVAYAKNFGVEKK